MRNNSPDKEGGRGVIINLASQMARDGPALYTAYSASKGGVASLTLPLARELGQHGIRVVAIAPGDPELLIIVAIIIYESVVNYKHYAESVLV